ncbi:citrate/2-methylcitrate synthase [Streptomyces sp. HPF1205]|uniref:citrate/2-methylcitrate synthase n=1 Tax=Streptomyces sp. HPF1205 TaxID=2873262 RepID=UPI001CEC199E|nr:citrate/2-methylcitrate synthase [Streptomyces sp. HPF1205]
MTEHSPDPADQDGRIGTREAARRLGVKPETLYAYVSRGLLSSRRARGGRGSTFDPAEIARLARRGRPASAGDRDAEDTGRAGGAAERGGAGGWGGGVRTSITLIDGDRYYFRGVDATALAEAYSFEEVAEWLWTGVPRRGTRFTAPPQALAAARRVAAALPAGSGPMDRIRVAVIAAASVDPLRFDLSRDAVLGSARALIPTLVDALPPAGGRAPGGAGPLAVRLWDRLTTAPRDEAALRALDAALALLIDHDLAASTLAARVAASARAHPYAVVSAALGALDGPLHGQASALAHRMLADVLERGAAPVVADHLRAGRPIPGLGHRLYEDEDPRARVLFGLLDRVPAAARALAAARDLVATAARHSALRPNVDLSLGVLTLSSAMPPEAGETVFAVSRTAGWIAHALEEYGEQPLRMRPSGAYDGPRPAQPLPLAPPPA